MNNLLDRWLDKIENIGNRLPNPTFLFVVMSGLVLVASLILGLLGLSAEHPINGQIIETKNLLSKEGLHLILTNTVKNFVTFAPVGTVLVAVMGLGIAEHSGLLTALLKGILKAPKQLLSFFVVSAGVLSSLAADSGYVVLIPLAGIIFYSVGRHPLLGIAAAFAGVSGGYSANLLIGPLEPLLAGISTEAAHLIVENYEVNAAGNYYFIIASTFLISVVGTWVTEKILAPRLAHYEANSAIESKHQDEPSSTDYQAPPSPQEKKALRWVGYFTLVFVGALLVGLLPESGILRDPSNGSVLSSPFIKGIVTVIAVYAAVCGVIYGKVSGKYRKNSDFIEGMEQHMGTMAGYLVLMFFAAQFVNYFAWSNLGSIIAINGAELLQSSQLPPVLLLVCFILLSACLNLFIGSASAKWALIAPIFVPMLLLMGITPEAAQVAYRIGDSSTNIITPLMPYFGVVVAFAQRYEKNIGIGSIISLMLPFSIAFLISWSVLMGIWVLAGWPLGPGADVLINLQGG